MANTYQGYNETSWERMATTVLAEHIQENELVWMRNFQMLALLEANGRVSYGHGGNGFDWRMRYKQHTVEGNTGETVRNYIKMSPYKVANLPWRGYQATDAISVLEKEAAKGPAAQVKIIDNLVGSIEDSIKQALSAEVWTDGSLAANLQMWHGMESIFGTPTQSFTQDTNVARAANVLDKVLINNQTYASINTAQGTYGGAEEASTSWPNGLADPEYDFASPVICNARSTAFGVSNTFAAQGDKVLRYCILASQRNTLVNTQVTNILLSRDYYNDLLNLYSPKEQLNITGVPTDLRGLGFKNVVQFDGVEVSWEASVPTSVGYGFNYNNIELLSMFDQLLRPEGPTYDQDSQQYKAVVSTLSNFKMNQIRSMFKIFNGVAS